MTAASLDEFRSKLAGWHFAKESLTDGEREILAVAEAVLAELGGTKMATPADRTSSAANWWNPASGHNLPTAWSLSYEGWVTPADVKRWAQRPCPVCNQPTVSEVPRV